MSSEPDTGRVAVAVPWYRERLTPDEEVSLAHLLHFLGERDIRIVKPEGLSGTLAGRPTEPFPDRCFESVETYSRLLLSADFYRRFSPYDYLLVYQLDALVLSAELEPWLEMPWDYIGAPWLLDEHDPSRGFSRVGNGGLSLRRVSAFLRVLERGRPRPFLLAVVSARLPDQRQRPPAGRLVKRLAVLREAARGVEWYAGHYSLNEDRFWSDRARLFDPDFRVAPCKAGLRFAFEKAPRLALEETGGALPFGAHGWAAHDRAFWEPHLLSRGRRAESTR